MISAPKRSTIRVAGLALYPLPGNCVLEYDDAKGRRRVMLLSDDLDKIAALQRAWQNWSAADVEALRWMDSHPPLPAPPPLMKTNPGDPGYNRLSRYLLGWDFGEKKSVIREDRGWYER